MSAIQIYALFVSPFVMGAVGLLVYYVTGRDDRRRTGKP